MIVSKDQSIILQVAGKIAADLTPKEGEITAIVGNWIVAYDMVAETLLGSMGFNKDSGTQPDLEQALMDAFGAVEVQPQPAQSTGGSFQVRIKGKQHGPIPAWLNTECAKAGVTEVWDNRDGLAVNPKRPWFKAVNGDKAFWEPRARR